MLNGILRIVGKKTLLLILPALILVIVGAIASSYVPILLSDIYSNISSGKISSLSEGKGIILRLAIIFLLSEVLIIVRRIYVEGIASNSDRAIRKKILHKLLKMPVRYFEEYSSGEVSSRVDGGIKGINKTLKILCNDIAFTVISMVVILSQVIKRMPIMFTAIMISYLVLILIVSRIQIKSQNNVRESIIIKKHKLQGSIHESVQNIELIRSFNAHGFETNRIAPKLKELNMSEKNHHNVMGFYNIIKKSLFAVFLIGLIISSLVMINHGKLEPAMTVTVCLLFQQLSKPIEEVHRIFDDFTTAFIESKYLLEIHNSDEDSIYKIKDSTIKPCTGRKQKVLELHKCDILDPKMKMKIIESICMVIKQGEVVKLEGKSGSGKSSLIKGLMRYYPVSGEIKLEGVSLDEVSQEKLTNDIYYSPQCEYIFNGSVRENLTYGITRKVSDKELIDAISKACLYDDLIKVSQEVLEIQLYEKGANLSGGMKQRLSIARVFLRNAKVYIFDEVTSNIDSKTTHEILSNLHCHALKSSAAIIHISHDKEIEKYCNKKIVLNSRLDGCKVAV